MNTPRTTLATPMRLALSCLVLLAGCAKKTATTPVDTAVHVTPKQQVSDVAFSSLQAARDRALTIVKSLNLSSDKAGVLCAPSYCGAEGPRCRGMRWLTKAQNDTVRERLVSAPNTTEIKRALQRIEFEMTDDVVRSGGSPVALLRTGDVILANRALIREQDAEGVLELLLAESVQMASLGAAGPFGGERQALDALSGCLVSYSRSIEGKIPRMVTWEASRVLFDGDPANSPNFTLTSPVTSFTHSMIGDVRITVEANWLTTFRVRKTVRYSTGFGYDVESTYLAASNRYRFRIVDSSTSSPVVLATGEADRLSDDDANARMRIEFKQNDVVVHFRGAEVVRGSLPKDFGAVSIGLFVPASLPVRRIRAEVLP